MLLKNRLFTPGPTPLLPAAQTAMASFTMHHRTADFRALFTRVLSDMKEFIGTKNDVLVLACSGTGVMEGARGCICGRLLDTSAGVSVAAPRTPSANCR